MQGCGPSGRPGSHITCSRECKECEGINPHTSMVNSHGGSWSPKWTPKTSESNFKGQNSMNCNVLYIIGNIVKLNCVKWSRIAHLGIWNTSYGQKKGHESNCQFDSRPQKVRNRPNLLICRVFATYCWKALNESYNFAWDYISIKGLLAKLWGSKVVGVPTGAISGLPLGSLGTKSHLDVGFVASHRV
jgi:hypothetical protein